MEINQYIINYRWTNQQMKNNNLGKPPKPNVQINNSQNNINNYMNNSQNIIIKLGDSQKCNSNILGNIMDNSMQFNKQTYNLSQRCIVVPAQ